MHKRAQLFSRLASVFVFTGLVVFSCLNGFAQTGSSSVAGSVTDQQGAVVAGATVKLINDERGYSRTAITSGSGAFSFSSVPPDTYRVEVEASGFKKLIQSKITALVDKQTTVSCVLEVGAVTEVINVAGGDLSSIVNTQDASLGNNFVSKQIQELPLEGRNVADLLSLQPGVTITGEVTGSRSDQANITLDGVDVNDQQNGTAFTPVLRVTPDSVDEFRVTTTNADSAKGRSSGAQISLSTKGGTNDFRGALYEYNRNDAFEANDFFSNMTGVPRRKLNRNLFGGRIGGPIIKDRLFFFYNYEALREAKEIGAESTVPLASLGQGIVRFLDADGVVQSLTTAQINALTLGGVPVVDVNPASLSVLSAAAARYPSNDLSYGDGLNTGGFRFNAKIPAANNTHTARIDWKVTRDEKHSIFFRGVFQDDFFDSAQAFPDTAGTRRISRPWGVVGSHTWLISNNLINNFRYGFTRQHFKDTGDATGDTITFRGVFSPVNYSYPFERRTDTQNFTDDFTWTKGNHTIQFGGNIRIVRNYRSDETAIHDNAVINRSYFSGSGNVLTNPILQAGYTINSGYVLSVRDAMAAVLGRYSQYNFNSNFDNTGTPLAAGVPVKRQFATEEYDIYVQDAWKVRKSLNITLGLRYGLSRPVYETQGYQTAPNVSLQQYQILREVSAAAGVNYGTQDSEALIIDLAGPANGKGNVYPWDKNNFQPNIAVAWSPNFKSGFLRALFGADSKTVIRGGFRVTNDYFGQALAVNFDANNTLGFASSLGISANTYNVTTNPGPLFTGFDQSVRNLPLPPGGSLPTSLTFPLNQPLDGQRRIEGSLDTNLQSPINYQWNVTWGRELPKGFYVEASYVGRLAKHLLATRDVMTPNNIRDPASGQTWYEAAGVLDAYRRAGTPVGSIPNQPFFENMYAAGSIDSLLFGAGLSNTQAVYGFMATSDRTPGCNGAPLFGCYDVGDDWTYLQDVLDSYINPLFFQAQYGALSAYGTIASSIYHGGTFSVRQRFKGLSWDLNYTFSKSIDDASGTQSSGVYGYAFILNALRPKDNRSESDFDTRHILNVNSVWEVPIGRGRSFFSGMNKYANAALGGWQFTSVFRYNSGRPVSDGMVDVAGWPTNWNVRSYVTRLADVQTSPVRNGSSGPNLFRDPAAFYANFRNAAPGETGDRHVIRYPGYISLDVGLYKSFAMPWNETHKLQLRVEAFNVTNKQTFTTADTIFGLDPFLGGASPTFGNLYSIQGSPRVMQFAIRYDF